MDFFLENAWVTLGVAIGSARGLLGVWLGNKGEGFGIGDADA